MLDTWPWASVQTSDVSTRRGKVYKKVKSEILVMNYLAENTRIPVPCVYHRSSTKESSQQLGAFMIKEFTEVENLDNILKRDTGDETDPAILDPYIDEEKLNIIY